MRLLHSESLWFIQTRINVVLTQKLSTGLATPQASLSLLLPSIYDSSNPWHNFNLKWKSRPAKRKLKIVAVVIIIVIIIITRTMFMVLSSWLRVIARVHPVHMINAEQCQMAADLWTKPTDLSRRPYYRQHVTTSTIAIYYYSARKLILILPSTEGTRLSRSRWLVTYPDSIPARKQSPIQVVTGPSVD